MLRKKRFILICALCAVLLVFPDVWTCAQAGCVQITDNGAYYLVDIDARSASHSDIGTDLAAEIASAVPDFESIIDSYIAEILPDLMTYSVVLARVNDILPQVPADYKDEVNAMITALGAGTTNVRGDGQLSSGEVWFSNLFPDVGRNTQCSAIGVYGDLSEGKGTMIARLLDWYVGSSNQLAKLQAVYRINYGGRVIVTIGFLGFQGVLSGYNDDNLFVGILDSGTDQTYSSSGKRSYVFDLRYALENESSLTGIADYMSDSNKNYAFNHLIFMADPSLSAVLENNFSGTGSNMRRTLRYEDSALNTGITWGFTGAVAAVNAFMLNGNHDNFTGYTYNTARWTSIKNGLAAKGDRVSWEELKEIATYDGGNGPGSMSSGDIYSSENVQIILFEPSTGRLEVAFHPKTGALPDDPAFNLVYAERKSMPWLMLLLGNQ